MAKRHRFICTKALSEMGSGRLDDHTKIMELDQQAAHKQKEKWWIET